MHRLFNIAATMGAGFSHPATSAAMTDFLTLAGGAVAIGAATANIPMMVFGAAAAGVAARQLYVNGEKLLSPAPVPTTPAP